MGDYRKMRDVEGVRMIIEPCPHCGEGNSCVDPFFEELSQRWRVGCGACGSSSGSHETPHQAVKAWNRRAPITDQITYRYGSHDRPCALAFADGAKISIKHEGSASYLSISDAPIVTAQSKE